MRILIVEDEAMIRIGLGKLISSMTNHEVVAEAKNGKEGLEMYQRYKPELIITDIRMPEMDGLQMLEGIRKSRGKVQVALLTGYAEFEYAKQAVNLGAVEYLLKPIGVEDVKALLEKVQSQLEEEQSQSGGMESCLRDLYVGEKQALSRFKNRLERKGITSENSCFCLYLGYVGAAPADYKEKVLQIIEEIKKRFPLDRIFVSSVDKMQEILIFSILDENSRMEFEHIFEIRITDSGLFRNSNAVWVKSNVSSCDEITDEVHKMQNAVSHFDLDQRTLPDANRIEDIVYEDFSYPANLENNIKVYICNGDMTTLESSLEIFKQYFRKHRFSPEHVKHGYIKLFSFIMNLLQEIDAQSYEQFQSMCMLRQISEARISIERENCLDDVLRFLQATQGRKENIGNYTIKRAINYIREHYSENIGLEEIALQLEITPEYLSSLFNKEVGTNFSTFLKEFRMSHARRLLKGSDLKIYEIAEQVGYHDAKYFMRVFKEVQGVSPKEFRMNS